MELKVLRQLPEQRKNRLPCCPAPHISALGKPQVQSPRGGWQTSLGLPRSPPTVRAVEEGGEPGDLRLSEFLVVPVQLCMREARGLRGFSW